MYIEEPDHTGHIYGPDSKEVDDKIEEINDVIGYLIAELKKRNLYENMNIIITADHGMASLSKDRLILLDQIPGIKDLIDQDKTFFYDTNAAIQPKNDTVKEILYDVSLTFFLTTIPQKIVDMVVHNKSYKSFVKENKLLSYLSEWSFT